MIPLSPADLRDDSPVDEAWLKDHGFRFNPSFEEWHKQIEHVRIEVHLKRDGRALAYIRHVDYLGRVGESIPVRNATRSRLCHGLIFLNAARLSGADDGR